MYIREEISVPTAKVDMYLARVSVVFTFLHVLYRFISKTLNL